MVSIHDAAALDALRRRWRIEPHHLRRLRNAFYKKHQTPAQALLQLPATQRELFAAGVAFHTLELHSRHDSQLDGATKLVYRIPSGQLIESVLLRIHSGRTSLCVSSQVGCAARCAFCATGHMGLVGQLGSAEILDQVVQANRLLQAEGRAVRNLVFMGMGEPLHNEAAVYEALEVMLSPQGLGFSPARVVLSTVGIPDALIRCARRFPRLHLALSLHSARQNQRERIVPLAKRYSLDELHRALAEVTRLQGQQVLIEYLMLDGLNDSDSDAMALTDYLRELPVHINLIPYNPIDEAPELRGTRAARRQQFAAALAAAGFTVTIRYSLGADIAAACGQLVRASV